VCKSNKRARAAADITDQRTEAALAADHSRHRYDLHGKRIIAELAKATHKMKDTPETLRMQ
jgi:hypothetical protein